MSFAYLGNQNPNQDLKNKCLLTYNVPMCIFGLFPYHPSQRQLLSDVFPME
jgi:hypothetical protein